MVIQIDSREKAKAIQKIIATFDAAGVTWISSKLPYGDYMNYDNPRLIIDRKQNLSELVANLSDIPERNIKTNQLKRYDDGTAKTPRRRFFRELEGAQKIGIQMIILCEHGGSIKSLEDVKCWINPRLKESPMAMSGDRLYKMLLWVQNKYNVHFEFCDKRQTGKKIIELLEVACENKIIPSN